MEADLATYRATAKDWYGSLRWKVRRNAQLQNHPLCAHCLKQNRIKTANVADHVTPHRGDPDAFWYGALQSLCPECHNSQKKRQEFYGYSNDIGIDGWPIDPNHPANAK